jgi:peptide/nickel transport system ATP-binding protein
MRQRAVIGIALACSPSILIADEPTTALDVTIQAQVLEVLRRTTTERGAALLLITHDLGVVAETADRIAVMYAGTLAEKATTAELFANMKHPYTEALLSAIPKLADPSHTRLNAIGGRPPDLVNPPEGCAFATRCPYAQDRCLVEQPALAESAPGSGHFFACHFPVGSPENAEIADQLAAKRLMSMAPPPPPLLPQSNPEGGAL